MRTSTLFALASLLTLTVVTLKPSIADTTTDTTADVAAITALYANWRNAVESADIPGYVSVLDTNVRLLPPDAEAIVGSAGYGKFLEPVFAAADYRIEVVRSPVIEVIGDVAVAEYDYIIHLKLKNADVGVQQAGALTAERTSARYIDVLRRNAEGKWAVYRHAWQNKTK
jgi:ketosteroid isomerase-like protein